MCGLLKNLREEKQLTTWFKKYNDGVLKFGAIPPPQKKNVNLRLLFGKFCCFAGESKQGPGCRQGKSPCCE